MIFEKCDRIHIKRKWNKSAKSLLAKSLINYLLNPKATGSITPSNFDKGCQNFSQKSLLYLCAQFCCTFPWNNTNTSLYIFGMAQW